MSDEIKRCSGHCCRDFTLPFSPEEVRMKSLRAQLAPTDSPVGWKRDIAMIADMLIFLRVDKNEHHMRAPWRELLYHYTCKNFDPATNNCTAYDTRPAMCRDYPYRLTRHDKGYKPRAEGQCNYRDCTRQCEPPKELVALREASEKFDGDDLKKFEEAPCPKL